MNYGLRVMGQYRHRGPTASLVASTKPFYPCWKQSAKNANNCTTALCVTSTPAHCRFNTQYSQ